MSSPFPKTVSSLRGLQARLRRRFSPSRHLRRSDGLQRIVEGGAGHEWIVARSLCAYTVLDGAAVPVRKRRGYAAMAIGRWSPFVDPQYHVEWVGDRAMVWAWSRGRVLGEGQDDVVALPPPRRLLPESLYRGHPAAEGEELLGVDSGFEGRVWRDHVLVASEWWPHAPDLAEWNLFRRGAGLASAARVPAPVDAELGEAAWTAPRTERWGDVATRHRSTLAAVAVGLGVAVLAAPLVAAIALLVSIRQVEGQIASQDQGLKAILESREGAERDLAAVEELLALRPPAGQIDLMATVLGLMPGEGWQLLEWRMPDPGKLEVVVRMARPDPRALVQAWESSGRFTGVTAELGRGSEEISISADIVRGGAR